MDATHSQGVNNMDPSVDQFQAFFEKHPLRARQICDLLEAIADDLPKRSAVVWREVSLQCRVVLQNHIAFGAKAIVPLLLQRSHGVQDRREVLLRFDLDYADMTERLHDLDDLFCDALATDRNRIDAEALGYALRDHFEALRRHMNWERDVLWPMALRVLGPADLRAVTKIQLAGVPSD